MDTTPASSRPTPSSRWVHRRRPAPFPASLTPLIGRERELALAATLLGREDVRLLTITGPGGIGKTRLALEIGRSETSTYPDGVVLVPLATISDADQVRVAVAQALGLFEVVGVAVRDSLTTDLRDASTLLILDNFEHVLPAVSLVTDLLAACPRLKIVVTSRALLHVGGEFALPVPPLDVPGVQKGPGCAELEQTSAVQLFVNRAQAIAPSFTLTNATAPVVVDICRRLEGVPLAIELAASQCSVLSPAVLLARISAQMPLPVRGLRDAPVRMRSMRDAVAWSYDLLSVDERSLFRRLGVFAGGFTLDAAEAIVELIDPSISPVPPQGSAQLSTLDLVGHLVDKSLVRQEAGEGESRYVMLETIRAFALEQSELHNEAAALASAHADWCLALAGGVELQNSPPGQPARFRRLEADQANLRAALVWLDRHQDGDRLLRLTDALIDFWSARGHYREACGWLEIALTRAPARPSRSRARVMTELSRCLSMRGQIQRAEDLLIEGIAILREHDDPGSTAWALTRQGVIANQLGAYDRAERVLNDALGMVSDRSDFTATVATIGILANLGIAALGRGELELARARHERALALSRASGYDLGAIRSLRDLGDVARDLGAHLDSLAFYRECLATLGDYRELPVVVDALEGTALAAAVWGQPETATRFMGAAEALREQFGPEFSVPTDRAAHERTLAVVRLSLPEPDLEAAWTAGRQLTLAQAIAEIRDLAPAPNLGGLAIDATAVKLSPREQEVLQLLAAGKTDRQIAQALYLSVRTVEAHVARILTRLGVRSRTAAVAVSVAAGIVDPVPPSPT